MPYLTCPSCRYTVSEAAARSPLGRCPRCRLRSGQSVELLRVLDPSPRFGRAPRDLERIAEAKSRLSGRAAGAGWA